MTPIIRKHMNRFLHHLWHNYFKKPFDTLPNLNYDAYDEIRDYFFDAKWYEVYDFIEFIANNYPNDERNKRFISHCNKILKEEMSAYRFVGKFITPIISETEIKEIEKALKSPIEPVRFHIKQALKLMSNRRDPDYRNSIKEAISAVEAMCKIITDDEKATLGQALDVIGERIEIHPAMRRAFSNLYGWTSSDDGIRHALLDKEVTVDFEEAKFMLVACSAFVNYLLDKTRKAGIHLRRG